MTKQGRPRGGKHHSEVREYWREQKGYKDKDVEPDIEELVEVLLGRREKK